MISIEDLFTEQTIRPNTQCNGHPLPVNRHRSKPDEEAVDVRLPVMSTWRVKMELNMICTECRRDDNSILYRLFMFLILGEHNSANTSSIRSLNS